MITSSASTSIALTPNLDGHTATSRGYAASLFFPLVPHGRALRDTTRYKRRRRDHLYGVTSLQQLPRFVCCLISPAAKVEQHLHYLKASDLGTCGSSDGSSFDVLVITADINPPRTHILDLASAATAASAALESVVPQWVVVDVDN